MVHLPRLPLKLWGELALEKIPKPVAKIIKLMLILQLYLKVFLDVFGRNAGKTIATTTGKDQFPGTPVSLSR